MEDKPAEIVMNNKTFQKIKGQTNCIFSHSQTGICVYLDTHKQQFLLVLLHLDIPSVLIFDTDLAPANYFYFA